MSAITSYPFRVFRTRFISRAPPSRRLLNTAISTVCKCGTTPCRKGGGHTNSRDGANDVSRLLLYSAVHGVLREVGAEGRQDGRHALLSVLSRLSLTGHGIVRFPSF